MTLGSCRVIKEDSVGAGPQKIFVNLFLITRRTSNQPSAAPVSDPEARARAAAAVGVACSSLKTFDWDPMRMVFSLARPSPCAWRFFRHVADGVLQHKIANKITLMKSQASLDRQRSKAQHQDLSAMQQPGLQDPVKVSSMHLCYAMHCHYLSSLRTRWDIVCMMHASAQAHNFQWMAAGPAMSVLPVH